MKLILFVLACMLMAAASAAGALAYWNPGCIECYGGSQSDYLEYEHDIIWDTDEGYGGYYGYPSHYYSQIAHRYPDRADYWYSPTRVERGGTTGRTWYYY